MSISSVYHISVVGGGTMGAGIAVSALSVGHRVLLVENDPAAAEAANLRVVDSMERVARKNPELDTAEMTSRLTIATDHGEGAADLVIEAVPEDLDLKRTLFTQLEHTYGPDTILATNTSSLSIDAIAAGLTRPGRAIGLHFFNPVPVSSLVEIVRGSQTDSATLTTAREFAEGLGKTPIVVDDSPGFASSRLGLALGLEAIRMVEEGVASAADIDTAMELGYRHPMGPLRLTDLVGLDVRLAIADHLHAELGDRFEPPDLLRSMVAEGRLGKKTGRGFHEW